MILSGDTTALAEKMKKNLKKMQFFVYFLKRADIYIM